VKRREKRKRREEKNIETRDETTAIVVMRRGR
jgi:hypothetical protein